MIRCFQIKVIIQKWVIIELLKGHKVIFKIKYFLNYRLYANKKEYYVLPFCTLFSDRLSNNIFKESLEKDIF